MVYNLFGVVESTKRQSRYEEIDKETTNQTNYSDHYHLIQNDLLLQHKIYPPSHQHHLYCNFEDSI